MKYIGLDCHKKYNHAMMIDTVMGEIKTKRLAHIKEKFREFILIGLAPRDTAVTTNSMGPLVPTLFKLGKPPV